MCVCQKCIKTVKVVYRYPPVGGARHQALTLEVLVPLDALSPHLAPAPHLGLPAGLHARVVRGAPLADTPGPPGSEDVNIGQQDSGLAWTMVCVVFFFFFFLWHIPFRIK